MRLRCYTGDCVNDEGKPLTHLLAELFGYPFILSYVVSYMLVAMGIFNVILAVYAAWPVVGSSFPAETLAGKIPQKNYQAGQLVEVQHSYL